MPELSQGQALELALEALRQIRTREGRVCSGFELCTHASCQSSHNAWAIADEALRAVGDVTGPLP